MSSLAAVQADGYYIDPSRFDHRKRGRDGYNQLAGSHPLGERAKRLRSEGILVIRFELPYDSWCLGCDAHIAMGVRYNADKKEVGHYLSTPIYEFRMTCARCSHPFVIRTDPKSASYEFVSGIRRKVKTFDAADVGLEALVGPPPAAAAALARGDPLYKLEHAGDDRRRADSAGARLTALLEMRSERWEDDYSANARLRATARADRGAAAAALADGEARGLRGVPLLAATAEDSALASFIMEAAAVERLGAGLPGGMRRPPAHGGGQRGTSSGGVDSGAAAADARTAAASAAPPLRIAFVSAGRLLGEDGARAALRGRGGEMMEGRALATSGVAASQSSPQLAEERALAGGIVAESPQLLPLPPPLPHSAATGCSGIPSSESRAMVATAPPHAPRHPPPPRPQLQRSAGCVRGGAAARATTSAAAAAWRLPQDMRIAMHQLRGTMGAALAAIPLRRIADSGGRAAAIAPSRARHRAATALLL